MSNFYKLSLIEKHAKEVRNEIKKQYSAKRVKEWDMLDIDDLSSAEAFDRGYFRALGAVLGIIKN